MEKTYLELFAEKHPGVIHCVPGKLDDNAHVDLPDDYDDKDFCPDVQGVSERGFVCPAIDELIDGKALLTGCCLRCWCSVVPEEGAHD